MCGTLGVSEWLGDAMLDTSARTYSMMVSIIPDKYRRKKGWCVIDEAWDWFFTASCSVSLKRKLPAVKKDPKLRVYICKWTLSASLERKLEILYFRVLRRIWESKFREIYTLGPWVSHLLYVLVTSKRTFGNFSQWISRECREDGKWEVNFCLPLHSCTIKSKIHSFSKHVLISPGSGIMLASGNFEMNHKNNIKYTLSIYNSYYIVELLVKSQK